MRKQTAPKNISLNQLLTGIRNDAYYTHSITHLSQFGFEPMTVDINATEFSIQDRYQVITTSIPQKKRGNLGRYAGKEVEIVVKGINSRGPRVDFYIRAKN